MAQYANEQDKIADGLLTKWMDIARDHVDDIGCWRDHDDKYYNRGGWPDPPYDLLGHTQFLTGWIAVNAPQLDPAILQKVYSAIALWYADTSADRLPPQSVLETRIDQAAILLNAARTVIHARLVSTEPSSGTGPGTTNPSSARQVWRTIEDNIDPIIAALKHFWESPVPNVHDLRRWDTRPSAIFSQAVTVYSSAPRCFAAGLAEVLRRRLVALRLSDTAKDLGERLERFRTHLREWEDEGLWDFEIGTGRLGEGCYERRNDLDDEAMELAGYLRQIAGMIRPLEQGATGLDSPPAADAEADEERPPMAQNTIKSDRYIFEKGDGTWKLAFSDWSNVVPHRVGFAYIHHLIRERQGGNEKEIHVNALVAAVNPRDTTRRACTMDSGGSNTLGTVSMDAALAGGGVSAAHGEPHNARLDDQGEEFLKKTLSDIDAKLRNIDAKLQDVTLDPAILLGLQEEQRKLQIERDGIRKELKDAGAFIGRKRKFKDPGTEKNRKNVSGVVDIAYQLIENTALHKHLKAHLKRGTTWIYDPPSLPPWSL